MAEFDTILRGGTIVDGSGKPAFTGDLAIRDGVIAAIGKDLGRAAQTVNADGLLVTPGWVDIHTHYDGQATWDPVLTQSLRHGVTTAVMGNCGVGFAPVIPSRRDWLIGLMEGVEDIPGKSLAAGIAWNWESFGEYLDALGATPRSFDVAAQIGHGALRAYAMGERGAANEAATADDIARMAQITREAMEAGAVGFSSSRTKVHIAVDGVPVPGTFAADDELIAIARAVKASGRGLIEIVTAGIAGEDCAGQDRDMDMLRRLAAAAGCPVMFLLLQHNSDAEQWRRLLAATDEAARAGHTLIPQVAGRPISILFCFEGEHPWRFMPSYQAIKDLPFAERYVALSNADMRRRLLSESDPNDSGFSMIYKNPTLWDHTYAAGSPIDYTPPPEQSIAALARRAGKNPWEIAYDLLLENGGRSFLMHTAVGYADGTSDAIHTMLQHPRSAFGLSDAGAHVRFIADAGVHSYMLAHWVRDFGADHQFHLPLEFVVQKLTAKNADLYGFRDRGRLVPGLRADLNLIDLARLKTSAPQMVYDLPADMPRLVDKVEGYIGTWVKGEVVQQSGIDTGARPGTVLRSQPRQ